MFRGLFFIFGFLALLLVLMTLGAYAALNGLSGAPELKAAHTEATSAAR